VAQETFVEEGKAKLVRTVTMELSQRQAEKLAAQINQGPIHLVLRNPADLGDQVAQADEKPVVKRSTVRRAPAPTKDTSPAFSIEVIQGDKQTEHYKF
jgi:pilus assembly protein CpaB